MILRLFKKHALSSLIGLFAITQIAWFWLCPSGFKSTWQKNPLVAEIIKEHALANEKVKIMAISYYYPVFSYFADIVQGNAQPKAELMDGYHYGKPYIFHFYYMTADKYFPQNEGINYLLGYSDYYLGNNDAAEREFEKSLAINQYFFWGYYNLGVIYFQQGQYYHSAMMLSHALSLNKDVALAIVHSSPFYRQIWQRLSDPQTVLTHNLVDGQQDALILLSACLLKGGAYAQAWSILKSAAPSNAWHKELWDQVRQQALNKQPMNDELQGLLQQKIEVRLF